MKRLWQVAIT